MKKLVYYILGSLLLSLGIQLAILSNIGAGAYDAMNANLAVLLNIKLGYAMLITLLVLFAINMIIKPKLSYFFGLLIQVILSLEVIMWEMILPEVEDLPWRILYFGISIVFLSLGSALIIRSKLPLSPLDTLMLIITEKTNKKIAYVKTLMEASNAFIAIIFGLLAGIGLGQIAFGTIFVTLLIGPGIQFFMGFIKEIKIQENEIVE